MKKFKVTLTVIDSYDYDYGKKAAAEDGEEDDHDLPTVKGVTETLNSLLYDLDEDDLGYEDLVVEEVE